ncbi:MAG: YggS family pyridoxal phosphate-dependent enzyme [Tannerella sp.]|jgi:pyridoxal phosphate enzyme (YggS family)|nr:YggS family pyridoxal phosphate-dependent enzyme [Tannerella sp.]
MSISQNLRNIKSSLPETVTLVAVSKFHPVEALQEAYDAGQRVFGESRVQELIAKQPNLPHDIEWHFIGTLQKNKVKYIASFIHTIQSIDSMELLKEVDKQAAKNNRTIRVLIEVHIAMESSKHGFSIEECRMLFQEKQFAPYSNICIAGLMGMGTFTNDAHQTEKEFQSLQKLSDELKHSGFVNESFTELSMGMSDDYLIAIQHGSTMIRIGTSIFGGRVY